MTEGFDSSSKKSVNAKINLDELDKLMKRYKKIKKYQRSNFFALHQIDGEETYIDKLLSDD